MEKIVQVGFDIPPAEPSKLKQLFSQALEKIDFLADLSEENIARWVDLETGGLNRLLRTPRDVVRYTNGLVISGGIVSEEVNPIDLVALEAIRTFAPELYYFIRDNRDIFVEGTGGAFSMGDQTTRQTRCEQLEEAYSLCDSEVEAGIREICSQIFPEVGSLYSGSIVGGYYEQWRKTKRICTKCFFPRYFYLRPSEQEVTQAEFESIIRDAADSAKLVSRFEELLDAGKIDNFLERLMDDASEPSVDNIEPMVLALFDVGDKLKAGLWSDNQLSRVASAVHKRLDRLAKPERDRILLAVATEAASLGALGTRLYSEHSDIGMQLLDESMWHEIRSKLVARIGKAAEDMTLAQLPHLNILLYRWQEWAPVDDSQRFVRRLIKSDGHFGFYSRHDIPSFYFCWEVCRAKGMVSSHRLCQGIH